MHIENEQSVESKKDFKNELIRICLRRKFLCPVAVAVIFIGSKIFLAFDAVFYFSQVKIRIPLKVSTRGKDTKQGKNRLCSKTCGSDNIAKKLPNICEK